MRKFANKALVAVLVGLITLAAGSVMAFAITPEDEAEAKAQAKIEAEKEAQLKADAAAEEAAKKAEAALAAASEGKASTADVEAAYRKYIENQAKYFDAVDDYEFKALQARILEDAAREAKAAADVAEDKAKGLRNIADEKDAEKDLAYKLLEDGENRYKKGDAELKKLKDAYDAAKGAAKNANSDAKGASSDASHLTKEANKAIGAANSAADAAKSAADFVQVCLAAF